MQGDREASYYARSRKNWFVLQVRTAREQVGLEWLQNKGYEAFLPYSTPRNLRGGSVRGPKRPLFPGYLFCRFDPMQRLPVLQTPSIVDILRIGNVPAPVPDAEVEALIRAQKANLERSVCSYFRPGQAIQIIEGPLAGVSGRVSDVTHPTQLIVDVSLLSRSISVAINPAWAWITAA